MLEQVPILTRFPVMGLIAISLMVFSFRFGGCGLGWLGEAGGYGAERGGGEGVEGEEQSGFQGFGVGVGGWLVVCGISLIYI
jgi:hypothetical protein